MSPYLKKKQLSDQCANKTFDTFNHFSTPTLVETLGKKKQGEQAWRFPLETLQEAKSTIKRLTWFHNLWRGWGGKIFLLIIWFVFWH